SLCRGAYFNHRCLLFGKSQSTGAIFFSYIVTGSSSYRHHCERWVLITARYITGAVGDEKIVHLVRLIEFVEHGFLRIVSHSSSAYFVNEDAGSRRWTIANPNVFGARSVKHLSGCYSHIADHLALVV